MQRYRVLRDRTIRGKCYAKAGDIVQRASGWDYGLASDDTRILGIEHISVARDDEKPFFTIPVADLEPIDD